MTHNEELQTTIEEALLWEPILHATHIRVQVADGIVTLSGTVDLYSKKAEAERVVKALHGVKALIEKIEVCHPDEWTPQADSVIAHRAVQSLEWNWKLPKDQLQRSHHCRSRVHCASTSKKLGTACLRYFGRCAWFIGHIDRHRALALSKGRSRPHRLENARCRKVRKQAGREERHSLCALVAPYIHSFNNNL